ncbi:MAG: response regulator [Archangiaceae bacterium]|nr:response regulator [Archangiaceae bacterium]
MRAGDAMGSPAAGTEAETVLAGAGEIGKVVRAIDWPQTPLGAISSWPQSLRTTLSICLNSRFPIAVYWGREYLMLYNQSLVPMVGPTKHPQAMGQPARVVLAEIWGIIEPLLRAVWETGEATGSDDLMLPLARTGAPEESYFTFTYSPIRDESGGVGGVFCEVVETTDQVIEGRRLRLLNAIASAATAKTPAAACTLVARELTRASADVPFALLYLRDAAGVATLAATANIEGGSALAPITLRPGGDPVWSFENLGGAPRYVTTGAGASAHDAVLLPIENGLVVLGLSPLLARSESYRRFHNLLAAGISQAVGSAASFEAQQQRVEALASLDRAKTAFFSNISHEFRTPLTLMLGPLEESLRDVESPLPPAQRARQEMIGRNGKRLLRLVNSLLDFSRIEAGRLTASFRPVDIGALTRQLASNFQSVVEKAGLSLVIEAGPVAGPTYVDLEQWEKVVLNLVSNAFKFTFEGAIRVSVRSEADRWVLEVADTGIGIAEAELPRLFDRFHRVENAKSRSYEGSGIGLALVRDVVKLHGGTITVESEPGRGTRFHISVPHGHEHLPADQVVHQPARPPDAPSTNPFIDEALSWVSERPEGPPGAEPSAAATGAHLLVADDNPDMREHMRQLLLAQGWSVVAVSSGDAALAQARRRRPDLVVTDVMMPGLDGFGLMRALRADPALRDVPCLLVSARAGEEAKVEALEAGADDYLIKPFSAKELVSRIAARLEVARAHLETRAARSRLRAQLMQAPVAVSVVTGPRQVYELANARYLEMVGRSEHQVVGRPFREVFSELPDDAPVFAMLEGVYRTGKPFTADAYAVPLDRDGQGPRDVYFLFTCEPLKNAVGEVTEIMTVAVDVTAQVQARQRVEALLSELRLADQRKDEFLAMLGHELRNPMATVSLALDMLGRAGTDTAKATGYRDMARRQMTSLTRLVDDLLDVSRITRGTVELRHEPLDLREAVTHAIDATRDAVEAGRHRLQVSLAPGTFPMRADATRLEQVVTNLLTNAVKYTAPGGQVTVELTRETADGAPFALLRVRDTGRGIPPQMLQRIFELFVQVDQTIDRQTGGLGLGLTLVKRLVEMHGGTVEARSEGPGQGSEFRVRLPLDASAQPSGGVTGGEAKSKLRRRRIVIADDSPDLRESFEELLVALGHQVTSAGDGLAAVAKILEVRPDVAFVDLGMPGIDGYEVARRVRGAAGGDRVRLVALTGYGGAEVVAEAKRAGFDDHSTKPFDLDRLDALLGG